MDDRQQAALSHLELAGRGLEIGPSYSPLVPKHSYPNIETVDHASQAELIDKYRAMGVEQSKLDAIEPVDHIWRGGSLVDTVGGSEQYDYVVAAHVIEHSTDLIAFLQDCAALLEPAGRLALVVPDKRTCFDRFKPLTSLGDVVDAHVRPTTFHPPGPLLDHLAYDCRLDGVLAWSAGQPGELDVANGDLSTARSTIERGLDQSEYHDAHRWVFTPGSFEMLVDDLREIGYHPFGIVASAPTVGFEFFVTLAKSSETQPRVRRIQQLLRIEEELAEVGGSAGLTGVQLDELARLRFAVTESRNELAALHASTSWRVTAPLRALSTRLRRFRS